ncbi:hypothetical protein K505DRAFT_323687 [Melanomma pulvis-pyrius CBS 109.77]|uniref:Uncharacterized protein n=1 Tax=Melanomma pulvis-pyrius CBS 109.77 TaxID=1314802 RepID=A0A6A6XID2_9PLEO|nr:hypothetical protein K505DRAFT_323687 [Melanomma pulvis-pyrius CBS 109.77]
MQVGPLKSCADPLAKSLGCLFVVHFLVGGMGCWDGCRATGMESQLRVETLDKRDAVLEVAYTQTPRHAGLPRVPYPDAPVAGYGGRVQSPEEVPSSFVCT